MSSASVLANNGMFVRDIGDRGEAPSSSVTLSLLRNKRNVIQYRNKKLISRSEIESVKNQNPSSNVDRRRGGRKVQIERMIVITLLLHETLVTSRFNQ